MQAEARAAKEATDALLETKDEEVRAVCVLYACMCVLYACMHVCVLYACMCVCPVPLGWGMHNALGKMVK